MVKKMNATHAIKRMVAVLLAAIALFTLSSCGTPEPENETTSVKFSEFEKTLQEYISAAEGYEMSLYDSADFSDGEKTSIHTFHISHDLIYSKSTVMLLVHCDEGKAVTGVTCMLGDGLKADIALISRYVYNSLGLSGMDSEAFYSAFAFFEESPNGSYEKEESGWKLDVSYSEDKVFFHALKSAS